MHCFTRLVWITCGEYHIQRIGKSHGRYLTWLEPRVFICRYCESRRSSIIARSLIGHGQYFDFSLEEPHFLCLFGELAPRALCTGEAENRVVFT